MQDSSKEQPSTEQDIPILKLDPQPCCLSQSIILEALSISDDETTSVEILTDSLKEMKNEKNLSVSSEDVQGDSASVSLQPISLQPISLQPISLQPISLQPISLQPISLQPISLQPISLQPISLQPISLQPISLQPISLQPISLETSSTSQSKTITDTKMEILSESLKENDSKEVDEDEQAKLTLQPTSLATSLADEKETITSIKTESLEENDPKNTCSISVVGESASVNLQPATLAKSETAESEEITSTKMEILSESHREIDSDKNLSIPSEELKECESASMALQPTSLSASSSSQSSAAGTSVETLAERLKGVDIRKKLGLPAEEGLEGESAAMTLGVYLDSINISALISTRYFLLKRSPYLKKLTEEAVKLHAFMETVNNLRHEFQPCQHTSLSCVTLIPESWHRLTRDFEIFQRQVGGLIDTTVLIMQQCEENSLQLRDEFVSYLDNLMVTSEDLGELEDMCNTALDKYRPVCFNYDNYYFLLHLSTTSAHLKPLQDRLTQECGKFSSFEAEISQQIKQAEGKLDDLF